MAKISLLLLLNAARCLCSHHQDVFEAHAPDSAHGSSIEHSPSFTSLSIEPAFWVEFVGTAKEPNELFFKLLSHMTERGGHPIIRPGGITMDSMIFDPNGGDPVRTMGPDGEIYRTTVGPAYFESWSNFPDEVKFVSTLNFGNDSLKIARDLAVASAEHHAERIAFFELGNEPNHFPQSRWNYETQEYVDEWKNWTASIDQAVDEVTEASEGLGQSRWWASSATTDDTSLNVRPVDVIPLGIDSELQVGQYSIHSYVFNSCTPPDAAEATIENLLNHTHITSFADEEVVPSARAAIMDGKSWIMGEFNSVACSGKINVSDTFTQALWFIDTGLTYAARNASSINLHQGATLVLQSDEQINTPGFSSYDFVYPRDSEKHGEARALPGFTGLLFLTEVFAQPKTRILPLETPRGIDAERFAGYAAYRDDKLTKLIFLNMNPYYVDSADDSSIRLDISSFPRKNPFKTHYKRLTAPSVDEKEADHVLWAGQHFKNGSASGPVEIESLHWREPIEIRGSEAVLVYLDDENIFGM